MGFDTATERWQYFKKLRNAYFRKIAVRFLYLLLSNRKIVCYLKFSSNVILLTLSP